MTYEYAVYFKLLLLCGYEDELQQYVDHALIEQNPLSDIILTLSTAGDNEKSILSALNEYLLQVNDADIDYDGTVFDFVMAFLQKKNSEKSLSMKAMTELMYRLARNTNRYFDEPWSTMYLMDDLFNEAESGCIDKSDFLLKFDAFINNKTLFCDYPSVLPKENFFKKLLRKIPRK